MSRPRSPLGGAGVAGVAGGAGVAASIALALAGCFSFPPTPGGDRAVGVYHDHYVSPTPSAPTSAAVAKAGPRKPAPSTLKVDDAIRMAKEYSPRLAELRERVEVAKQQVDATDVWPNPELHVSPMKIDEYAEGQPVLRPSLRVTFPRPGEVASRVAEARAAETAARGTLAGEERAIEIDVRWQFENLQLLDAEIATSKAVTEARRALSLRIKDRVDASLATELDDTLAELSAVDAEEDGAELVESRRVALGQLLDLIGADATGTIEITGEAPGWPPPPLPAEKALVEAALKTDPGVVQIAARMDAARARISRERGKQYPWFSFAALGYQFGSGTNPGFTIQAGIELPIFDTNRAAVRASEASLEAETRALATEVERVVRDVRDKRRKAGAAEDLVTNYRARALPAAARAAAASKQALDGNGIDATRALLVEERRVLVEVRLLRLTRRYRGAVADLRGAVGGRLPAEGT